MKQKEKENEKRRKWKENYKNENYKKKIKKKWNKGESKTSIDVSEVIMTLILVSYRRP